MREIQTQHSHIVVTKWFCEEEQCITGKARCSRGLGFRVLQLEEICSNAGKKLKMHGRGRLTGSHVKVNEKVQIAVCNKLEQNHLVQIQIQEAKKTKFIL